MDFPLNVKNENAIEFALKNKLFRTREEVIVYLKKFYTEKTNERLRKAFSKDVLLIQAVSMIQEIEKNSHVINERVTEWYSYYNPENPDEKTMQRKKESIGMELNADDKKILETVINESKENKELMQKLEQYIDKLLDSLAPNLKALCGFKLAAELIKQAGSLENLAKMPGSKIQVIGAEKAMFRHLAEGAKPPKHGIILKHEIFRNASREVYGKIARHLAGKISICVRTDFYSKEKNSNLGKKYLDDLKRFLK